MLNPQISRDSLSFPRLISWAQKGGFAIADQALFAGSNFIINILLARWLPPAEYGAFTVAFSIFLLLGVFYSAVVIEPMSVFGPGKYMGAFRGYIRILLSGHIIITVACSIILAMIALFCRNLSAISHSLFGLALALPFILFIWLLRRIFYVPLKPQWAAAGGALYLFLMMIGAYTLLKIHLLNSFSVLFIMGMSSFFVGLCLFFLSNKVFLHGTVPLNKEVLYDHWNYGKWLIATGILMWIPGNLYYLILPGSVGLEGSAALKAIMNLVFPIMNVNTALSALLVPKFVQELKIHGKEGAHRFLLYALIIFIFLALFYWVILIYFRYQLINLLYKGQYLSYSDLLIPLGMLCFFLAIIAVLGSILRAMELPYTIFWSYAATAAVSLSAGVWLITSKGVYGAVSGFLISYFVTVIFCLFFYIKGVSWKKKNA